MKTPCTLGQLYTDVRVEKKIFGNSYLIKLDNSPLLGLLHKSNIPRQEDLAEADDQAEGDNTVIMPDYDKAMGTNSEDNHVRAANFKHPFNRTKIRFFFGENLLES